VLAPQNFLALSLAMQVTLGPATQTKPFPATAPTTRDSLTELKKKRDDLAAEVNRLVRLRLDLWLNSDIRKRLTEDQDAQEQAYQRIWAEKSKSSEEEKQLAREKLLAAKRSLSEASSRAYEPTAEQKSAEEHLKVVDQAYQQELLPKQQLNSPAIRALATASMMAPAVASNAQVTAGLRERGAAVRQKLMADYHAGMRELIRTAGRSAHAASNRERRKFLVDEKEVLDATSDEKLGSLAGEADAKRAAKLKALAAKWGSPRRAAESVAASLRQHGWLREYSYVNEIEMDPTKPGRCVRVVMNFEFKTKAGLIRENVGTLDLVRVGDGGDLYCLGQGAAFDEIDIDGTASTSNEMRQDVDRGPIDMPSFDVRFNGKDFAVAE
jgi:hypothetical protein